MNHCKKNTMRTLLLQLAVELQANNLWDENEPDSVKDLHSVMPFAVDVLAPHQWLQWVFIPKMWDLIQSDEPLPAGYALLPYFEEALKDDSYEKLLSLIGDIDELGEKTGD